MGFSGGTTGPCVFPALGPSQSNFYWSANLTANQLLAWGVNFYSGEVGSGTTTGSTYVRAVRSGL